MLATNSSRRILVIDDNPSIHDDFRKILGPSTSTNPGLDAAEAELLGAALGPSRTAGFEVDSAFQGEEGLKQVVQAAAEGRPYSMAFVDVRMPTGWDGIETTAKIWEVYPDLQVVICTAYSDYPWEEMIAKIGQSDRLVILKKPFDNVEVLQLASALVAKWQLLQQLNSHLCDLETGIAERTKSLEGANLALAAEIAFRDQIEIQLRHAQKMESIGQLAAGIAHEINTPAQYIGDNTRFVQQSFGQIRRLVAEYDKLFRAVELGAVTPELVRAVRSAADTADMEYLGDEIPKAIQQSLNGISRVTHIVQAMKEFSHPGTKEKVPVDLTKAIQSTLTVASNEWKYVANLTTDFDPKLPPVSCLHGEFNQVILNLVVNAAHAIAEVVGDGGAGKGTLTVSTRSDGDWAEVRIGDTGTGIPEAVRARIFDPFFTTKAVGKGTGQGLAIAHSVIVDKHGGTIHFETELGRGTTFIIRLPINSHFRLPLEESE